MSFLRKIAKLLGAATIAAVVSLIIVAPAIAQTGFGVGTSNLWKRVSGALLPVFSTDTIGSSGNRVAGVYADLLDGTSVVIGGSVAGNMVVTGSVTAYNGFSGPTISVTSTGQSITASGTISAANFISSSSSNGYLATAGTPSKTAYSFVGDIDTGMDTAGANVLILNAGAATLLSLGAGAVNVSNVSAFTGGSSITIGQVANVWGRAYLSGVSSTGGVYPSSNNAFDVGGSTLAWRDIHASGTAFLQTVSSTHTTSTEMHANSLSLATSSHAFPLVIEGNTNGNALGPVYITNNSAGTIGTDITLDASNGGVNGKKFSLISTSSGSGPGAGYLAVFDSSASLYRFSINGANGNVGIGTNTAVPATKLEVVGTVSSTAAQFSVLPTLDVTSNLVCVSATGTLRQQAGSCTVSSARFKENIQSLTPEKAAEIARKLRSVTFEWKQGYAPNGEKYSEGFIAEEVAMVDPSLVVFEESNDPEQIAWEEEHYPKSILRKDGKTYLPKTVDYARFTVIQNAAWQYTADEVAKLKEEQKGILGPLLDSIKRALHIK